MSFANRAAALTLLAMIAAPVTAWAFVGVPGCTNLPLYNRALGALQGMTSACDMSVEEARRIVAEHDGPAAASGQAALRPQVRAGRHRARKPHR